MTEEIRKINDENAKEAAGGSGYVNNDYVHDLNNFVYRTVSVPAGTVLQMQWQPNGAFMSEMYNNGDQIFVHRNFWEDGYFLAWKNGIYGFVDAKYVR